MPAWSLLFASRYFNPRSLHGERPYESSGQRVLVLISIHAPCTGSDGIAVCGWVTPVQISIHAPCTGSDAHTTSISGLNGNFNPRSLHGERRYSFLAARRHSSISIHAPCTGSDVDILSPNTETLISIHAPCTGSDRNNVKKQIAEPEFQSTLPARGATNCTSWGCYLQRNFNPRSLHGERHQHGYKGYNCRPISIHAPCTGSDASSESVGVSVLISIHAPCTGSDTEEAHAALCSRYFNPRSLHGERPFTARRSSPPRNFNPRSLHGERPASSSALPSPSDFNPRSLHGERRNGLRRISKPTRFQSTLPARGAT